MRHQTRMVIAGIIVLALLVPNFINFVRPQIVNDIMIQDVNHVKDLNLDTSPLNSFSLSVRGDTFFREIKIGGEDKFEFYSKELEIIGYIDVDKSYDRLDVISMETQFGIRNINGYDNMDIIQNGEVVASYNFTTFFYEEHGVEIDRTNVGPVVYYKGRPWIIVSAYYQYTNGTLDGAIALMSWDETLIMERIDNVYYITNWEIELVQIREDSFVIVIDKDLNNAFLSNYFEYNGSDLRQLSKIDTSHFGTPNSLVKYYTLYFKDKEYYISENNLDGYKYNFYNKSLDLLGDYYSGKNIAFNKRGAIIGIEEYLDVIELDTYAFVPTYPGRIDDGWLLGFQLDDRGVRPYNVSMEELGMEVNNLDLQSTEMLISPLRDFVVYFFKRTDVITAIVIYTHDDGNTAVIGTPISSTVLIMFDLVVVYLITRLVKSNEEPRKLELFPKA